MPDTGASDSRIRFGVFEADPQSRELFKEGRRVPLANQSFVALATLLERPGQLVSREELRQRLWPDGRVVEFDQGLNAIINRLRDALGAGPDGAGLIETLPRRGYRFVGVVQGDGLPGTSDSERLGQPLSSQPRLPDPASQSAQPQQTAELQRRRARGRWLGLPITAAVLVALIIWAATFRPSHPTAPQLAPLKLTPLTSLVGREVSPDINPAGNDLLFAWNGAPDAGGHFDLYSRPLDSERLTRITHDAALALHAAWAPEGRRIALARETDHESGIFLLPAGGGPERLLAVTNFLSPPFMQLGWSPDGQQVAYASIESDGWSHIDLVDVPRVDAPAVETTPPAKHSLARPPGCADAGIPAFSPDGHRLAFVCTSSIAVYNVDVTDLATGATRSLLSLQGNPEGLAWTAKGDALIVANDSDSDGGLWRITLDGHSSQLLHAEGSLGPGLTVARQGIAFVRESNVIDIWRADLSKPESPSENLISSTRTQLVPAYSPDGTRIAFQSNRSGSPEIWLADRDGRDPVKLTSFNGPLTGAPSWCQDGRRIAFDSRASGSSAIYVLDIFERQPHRLETSQPNLALPAWSPDCRWIIASNGRTALYRVPASGGPAENFTAKRAYRAVIVDSRVIFNVAADTDVALWSKPAQSGVETPLEGMAALRYQDSWAPTAHGIYYTSSTAHGPLVNFYDFTTHDTHVVRPLEHAPDDLGGLGISVSADERWLLYSRSERSEGDIMMLQAGDDPTVR